ncbi:MAG: rod shape-determining protein [Ferrimicrobium sp.]
MSRYALDLGATQTRLLIGNEPLHSVESWAAVDPDRESVQAIGRKAREVVLANSSRTTLVSIIKAGSPTSPRVLAGFLHHLLRGVGVRSFGRSEVTVGLSLQSTPLDRTSLERGCQELGARPVALVPSIVAAAVGAGISVDEPEGALTVLLGESTLEAGVTSLGGLAASASMPIGIGTFRYQTRELVRTQLGLIISDDVAGEIIYKLFDCNRANNSAIAQIWGRNTNDGSSASAMLHEDDLYRSIEPILLRIAETVTSALLRAHTQLISDIADQGIILTGGGANLSGLDSYLSERIAVAVTIASEPELCVARGLRSIGANREPSPLPF